AVGGRHGRGIERGNDLSEKSIARHGNHERQAESQPKIDQHRGLEAALGQGKATFQPKRHQQIKSQKPRHLSRNGQIGSNQSSPYPQQKEQDSGVEKCLGGNHDLPEIARIPALPSHYQTLRITRDQQA
ncbi:MAG: hypothetical protein RL549_143, partial [Verrucomicrobiota bacterium]